MTKTEYRIYYRDNGRWAAGSIYSSKEAADRYAQSTGRCYKVEKVTKRK